MSIKKRLAAILTAAVTAISLLTLTVSATDPVGTNPITLKEGEQGTATIKYDKSKNYDNGHNYVDFKYTAPDTGVMEMTIDIAINRSSYHVYNASNYEEIKPSSFNNSVGKGQSSGLVYWKDTAGIYSGTATYNVEKGQSYIIRVSRWFFTAGDGELGNGRVHITCEMEKPDPPVLAISSKSGSSVSFTWNEPDTATSYDIRYKVSTAEKWTIKKDINDNKATVSGLKANTKYYFQIRAKADGVDGNWSKSYAVTTGKSGSLSAPSVSGASKSVTVSWKSVSGAAGYTLQYSTDQKNWTSVSSTATSASFPVSSGKTYYYRVCAKDGSTTSSWSKTYSVKA